MTFKFPEELIGHVYIPDTSLKLERPKKVRVSAEGKVNSRVDPRNYRGNGHWQYLEEMGGKNFVGFIYVIVDMNTRRLYLGKKNYRTLKIVEGTTRRQSTDMAWRWYISSSTDLSASIKNYGKEGFEFICIEQYTTKGMLSYAETWSLLHVESPSNEALWYNRLINKVAWYVKTHITQDHRERLDRIVRLVKEGDFHRIEDFYGKG
jgi:hypothetical protein